jgi:hypothetical protein
LLSWLRAFTFIAVLIVVIILAAVTIIAVVATVLSVLVLYLLDLLLSLPFIILFQSVEIRTTQVPLALTADLSFNTLPAVVSQRLPI